MWLDDIKHWTKLNTYEAIKRLAEDRCQWRACTAACQPSEPEDDSWWWMLLYLLSFCMILVYFTWFVPVYSYDAFGLATRRTLCLLHAFCYLIILHCLLFHGNQPKLVTPWRKIGQKNLNVAVFVNIEIWSFICSWCVCWWAVWCGMVVCILRHLNPLSEHLTTTFWQSWKFVRWS